MLVNLIRTLPLVGLLILQCLASLNLKAQGAIDTTGMRQQVKREAELFLKAGFAEDYNTVIKHYHPEQIEALGGEKNLLKELKAGSRLKNKAGFSSIQFSIALPEELLIEDDAIQCAFRYTLHLPKTNFSEAQPHQSTMIAVSEDRGKNWYFLDAQDTPVDRLTMFFSFINPNLNLPVDPAAQAQIDALNWEIKPFIRGKNILNFNRKEQRIIFNVNQSLSTNLEGLINTQGQLLIKPEYLSIDDLDSLVMLQPEDGDDELMVKPGQWDNLLSVPEKPASQNQLELIQVEGRSVGLKCINLDKGEYRLEALNGKLVAQFQADYPPSFTKRYVLYQKNNLAGLFNYQGKELIVPAKYGSIQINEDEGLPFIAKLANVDHYVLIDTLGNPVSKIEGLSSIFPADDLFYHIAKEVAGEPKYGVMDHFGKVAIPPNYEYPLDFNNVAYAQPKGDKWELKSIKNHQALLADRTFDIIEFAEDWIVVADQDKKLIEVYSNALEKKLSLNIDAFKGEVKKIKDKEVLFVHTREGKIGYQLDGKLILPEAVFEDPIAPGLVFVQNGKMGLVTPEGKILVPAALDEIKYLEDSQSLWGKTNGKWGLLKL